LGFTAEDMGATAATKWGEVAMLLPWGPCHATAGGDDVLVVLKAFRSVHVGASKSQGSVERLVLDVADGGGAVAVGAKALCAVMLVEPPLSPRVKSKY